MINQDRLIKTFLDIIKTDGSTVLGADPKAGGATDVNILHTHGIEAIVISAGDYQAHTKREYLKISEMLQTAQFCQQLLTTP